ncbi:MAG: orotidine-5'-phosphate decarboxylase [Bryocella sp.]
MNPIARKYEQRSKAVDSFLCVGLDPVMQKLPQRFRSQDRPFFAFNRWLIDETAAHTAAYKLNMAFYEARGVDGYIELKMTIEYLREHHPEIMTICDAKRGDTANTNQGYVSALFDELGFDAVTLHPYLGAEALAPFLERQDKACILLCRTSNPGATEFQDLEAGGQPLWLTVAQRVAEEWDTDGNCMLVVGATYPSEMSRIRAIAPRTTFLVPGIGAQGGDVNAVVAAGMTADGGGLIVSSSREIIYADDPAAAARAAKNAINAARTAAHASR